MQQAHSLLLSLSVTKMQRMKKNACISVIKPRKMLNGVVSNDGYVMPLHIFEGLTLNQNVYQNVLETVVKPWIEEVAAGRKKKKRYCTGPYGKKSSKVAGG